MIIKDYVNAALYRASILAHKLRYFAQKKLNLVKYYQPDPFSNGNCQAGSLRGGADRYHAISKVLPNGPLSCLDIGCNEGYFVFKMAERGGFCLGVDAGRNEIMIANSLAKIHKVNNVAFINEAIDLKKVRMFPEFDVVIFMSVFHHLARHNGLDYARNILQGLADSCGGYMIFETGQPDEENVSWTNDLDFMLPDVKEWCTQLLLGCGFQNVEVIGEHKAVNSTVPRYLFLATKQC